jgi:excisionase family DNA binding protein
LLSTRQVAERLGVSEASVRRWSDSGALPVQRVGRRGERRFQPEHVERVPARGGPTKSHARPTGHLMLAGRRVHLPFHVAAFYDSDAGRVRLTVPFLAEGIRAGQPCFLCAQGEELDSYLAALDATPGIHVDDALANGVLTVVAAPGRIVSQALEFWEKNLWAAMDRHAHVMRAVGEMVSEREHFRSEDEMLAYEAAFNGTSRRFPCGVICQYDVRKFSGPAILCALRAHPDILDMSLSLLIK